MTSTGPFDVPDLGGETRRTAPAAARNVGPIADVLDAWLPATGVVLEVASGTGEHALAFARRFAGLEWQPSDSDPLALASIEAWRNDGPPNLRSPLMIDAAMPRWPIGGADAVVCINMVHISPWASALGLADAAARLLPEGGPLILYGPWLIDGIETAPSNLAFDIDLRNRDPRWGLRLLSIFRAEVAKRGFSFVERRAMPANNVMLLFRLGAPAAA